MAFVRLIGSMHVECIVRSRTRAARRDQSVPNISAARRQVATQKFSIRIGVEQADLDPRRMTGIKRKIDAALALRGAQWPRHPGLNELHQRGSIISPGACTGPMKNIAASGGKFKRSENGYP